MGRVIHCSQGVSHGVGYAQTHIGKAHTRYILAKGHSLPAIFAAFNGDSGVLAVECRDGKKYLSMRSERVRLADDTKSVTDVACEVFETVELTSDKIYLRIDGDFRPGRDIASFRYSYDNKSWTPVGCGFRMVFDYRRFFMGTKFAIFNYATRQAGGHVDVDFFDYERIRN